MSNDDHPTPHPTPPIASHQNRNDRRQSGGRRSSFVAVGVVPTRLLLSGLACLKRKPGSSGAPSSPLVGDTGCCVVRA
jgi:hypothetical protein